MRSLSIRPERSIDSVTHRHVVNSASSSDVYEELCRLDFFDKERSIKKKSYCERSCIAVFSHLTTPTRRQLHMLHLLSERTFEQSLADSCVWPDFC